MIVTAVAIYSIVALGLGLLIGRVGLVSLGQIALLALGGWVARAARCSRPALPFPLVLLVAGLITMVLGTIDRPARAAAQRPLPGARSR